MSATKLIDTIIDVSGRTQESELIRRATAFAEKCLEEDYRYCVLPDDDDYLSKIDWDEYHWIRDTPARTPAGWHAKALFCSAWNRDAYDDRPRDSDNKTAVVAALLRDIVSQSRGVIIERLKAKYGPPPRGYTDDFRFIGLTPRQFWEMALEDVQRDPEPNEHKARYLLEKTRELIACEKEGSADDVT
jgi:hypothetical protein